MASAGERISEVAKKEGDNSKDSTAAQMQSNLAKSQNLEQKADEVGSKMASDPFSVTSEDAQTLQSRTSRAQGGGQPPSDSLASQAQSLASANEEGTTPHVKGQASTITPAEQSQLDREANYVEQADKVTSKLGNDPASVTEEDANTMHSREQRAFGITEKGGVSSMAESQVAVNEGAKK